MTKNSWIDDLDVSDYVPPSSRRSRSKGSTDQSDLLPKTDLPPITPEAVKVKMQEYLKDLDETTVTRIDLSQLMNLARLSLNIEALNTALSRASEGIYTAGQVRTLSTSIRDMMAEERQQAVALGLSRSERITGQQNEMELYLPKLKKQTRDLMGERVILILCDKCLAGKSIEGDRAKVNIRHGMLLYHFAKVDYDWNFTGNCMRCHSPITINHKNYTKYLLKEWDKPIVLSQEDADKHNALEDEDVVDEEI